MLAGMWRLHCGIMFPIDEEGEAPSMAVVECAESTCADFVVTFYVVQYRWSVDFKADDRGCSEQPVLLSAVRIFH